MATIRYDTLGVFVGPDIVSGNLSSGDITQLSRVQATNYSIEIQRENVMGLGTAFANDNVREAPFVNLTVDYLVTNGKNEKTLGFVVDGLHGSMLNLNSGERDFFLLVNKEEPMVLGIGNGMLARYSVSAAVNDFVKAQAEIRGFNIQLDQGTSGNVIPRVDLDGLPSEYTYQLPPVVDDAREREVGYVGDNIYVSARDLDIRFPNNSAFGVILSGNDRSHLQSFNLSLGVNRSEITRLGDKYPFKRCLQLPMELTLSADLLLEKFVADNIRNYFCQDSHDIDIDIKDSRCTTFNEFWEEQDDTTRLKYMLRGMKLKSFSSADSIGDRKNVRLEWSVPVGNLLDLNRNLFFSGNFGRYLFPLDQSQEVSGENVTGQNLRAVVREVSYRRTKVDVRHPDFNVEFSGDYSITPEDPEYSVFYQGSSGIVSGSGQFGSGLTESTYAWNSDSYNTVYDGLPTESVAKKFGTFYPKYAVGYPSLFDTPSGQYTFVTKGVGFNTEPVEISFAGLPTWVEASVEHPRFSIDPYKPYYFNTFNLHVNAVDIPTGQAFEFQMIARNSKFKKVYTMQGETPYSFHISLPQSIKKKTSLFLEPYDETTVDRTGDNLINSIENDTFRSDTFTSYSGSGSLPVYAYNQLNDKSYIHLESGAYLSTIGPWLQDFRNFTFFAVYKPEGSSESNASLLRFYHTGQSGILSNTSNEAFFGRNGSSQDLEFWYKNPAGTSGLSGAKSNVLTVTSTWDTNGWNLATITYDGVTASGRRNGTLVATQNLTISNSGYFSNVEIGALGYQGDVAELILLPYKLTPTEVTHVEAYLRYKWGL